jgi:hypothetical protein
MVDISLRVGTCGDPIFGLLAREADNGEGAKLSELHLESLFEISQTPCAEIVPDTLRSVRACVSWP